MKQRYYAITLLVLLLDHLTKWAVRAHMDLHSAFELVPNYLNLSYVQNSGVAFGLLSDIESVWKPYILAAIAVVAVIIILVYSSRMPLNRKLLQVALAIILGGILGNFMDRLVHGFVVDFIEFHIYDSFHWPNFNIADSAITIGIALLLLDTLKNPELVQEVRCQ
jgi:signal peptidase II